jgi:hypothetical protein
MSIIEICFSLPKEQLNYRKDVCFVQIFIYNGYHHSFSFSIHFKLSIQRFVCSFVRPLFLFPYIQSVVLNKRLRRYTPRRLHLSLPSHFYFFIGSFHIEKQANYGCHFISSTIEIIIQYI